MDIRIGITHSPRELSFESSQTAAALESLVASALESGASVVKFADDKGKVYLVPAAAIAYVEIGTDSARRVGFVA